MRTLKEIFANTSRVVRNPGLGECWEWSKYRNDSGYGQVGYKGNMHLVHRLVAGLVIGDVSGKCAMHMCDNPPCINPQHLEIGTSKQNSLDYRVRKRVCTIQDAEVIEIREAIAAGETISSVVARTGRSKSFIHSISIGLIHLHVGGPIADVRGVDGENNPAAKLTAEEVLIVRGMWANGISQANISKATGIPNKNVWQIVHRKRWKHVPMEASK